MKIYVAGPRRTVQGFALVVVLVLVAVIALGATASLRTAMRSAQVAQSHEQQVLAHEAARMALRYCERAVLSQPAVIEPLEAPADAAQPAWQRFDAWHGEAAAADSVPDEWWFDGPEVSGASAEARGAAPQCLAEWGADPAPGVRWLTITARGLSPDFQADDLGLALQGAQTWLQTSLLLVPADAGAEAACEPACAYEVVDRVWTVLADPPQP